MLEIVGELLASSGLGAIVGAVGNYFGKIEERKSKELEFRNEALMRRYDLEELRISQTHALDLADKEIAQTEVEGAIAADVEDAKAFTESIRSAAGSSGSSKIDALRGAMRPLISLYLLALTTYMAIIVFVEMGGVQSLPSDEIVMLAQQIIQQVLFLTTAATMWWFGSRRQGPLGSKK